MSENSLPIVYRQPDEEHNSGEDHGQDNAVEILRTDPPPADDHDDPENCLDDHIHNQISV